MRTNNTVKTVECQKQSLKEMILNLSAMFYGSFHPQMSEKPPQIRSHTFERTALVITMLLLIAAAICLSIMISHFQRRQAANRITLANGTQVELLGTVLGDAPFNVEKPWQKFARQYLPGRLKNLVPAEFAADRLPGMDSNYLSVFLRVSAVPPALGSFPWGSADPEDAAGFLYLHSLGSSMSSGAWSNAVCRLIFTSYPRRQSDFFLRFADQTGAAIGKLPVPNPSTGPFPQWHAMPLPQTQTNGPVVLALQSLEEQLGAVGTRPDLGGLNYWAMIFPQTHLVSKDPEMGQGASGLRHLPGRNRKRVPALAARAGVEGANSCLSQQPRDLRPG